VTFTTPATTVPARIYAVRTRERGGLSTPWSNAVGSVPRVAPPPPGNLAVEAQKTGVALTWVKATDAVGYVVLRREATDPEWGAPVANLPADAVSYLDRAALYGSRYVYTVLSLALAAPPIESAPQSAREVDYRDLFAPEPPTELRALLVAGQVRLVWDASPDADLAGYRIERAPAGGAFAALPGELATGTDASIAAPPAGSRVRYRLVAIDRNGNAAPATEPVLVVVP
jgi:hypothetical protein